MKAFTDFQAAHKSDTKLLQQRIFLGQITDSYNLAANQSKMLPYSETVPTHPHAPML